MGLFGGAAAYYRRFRPGIPDAVASVLDEAAPRRSGPRRLLDVGTGTGMVVEALMDRFDDVIGVDSDAGMLAAAESALRPLPQHSRLSLVCSSAEEFEPPAGWRADLATIARAFHWMDQSAVLARLDGQVVPDGAIAVFGDRSFWTAGNPWQDAVREVVQSFLGDARRAGTGTFQPSGRAYRDIIAESPFGDVSETHVPVERTWTVRSVLGYLYSTSFAAPHLFGDRRGAFEAAVSDRLADFSGDGTFIEHNEFEVLLGRRSAD